MIVLGLTGGIGSGKSTVSAHLRQRGIPVFESDAVSKRLMNEDPQVRARVMAAFGPEAYTSQGLNRPWLAAQVFGNTEKLAVLNAISHPAVQQAFARWRAEQAAAGHGLAFKEAAILYEAGADKELDGVVLVACPEPIRIQRVMARDGISEADVRARIARQWPEEKKRALAQFIIENDGIKPLEPQIDKLLATMVP